MRSTIKKIFPFFLLILFSLSPSCSVREEGESILVFCGSASKPAMEEIARNFTDKTGIPVDMIFGGSGTLLSQIELARKGEIYLPGSPDYISIGERKKQLFKNSDRIVAYLVPAIITPVGNPARINTLEDLAKPGMKIGIGNPETVCLGLYAIELLEKNKLLDQIMANVITFGGSCSKTANLAAMNKVDAILGWRVFHFWNPDRMEYVEISGSRIPRISYIPIAIPVYTRDRRLSEEFIDYVLSPEGARVYEKLGYIFDREDAEKFAPGADIGGEYRLPPRYYQLLREDSARL